MPSMIIILSTTLHFRNIYSSERNEDTESVPFFIFKLCTTMVVIFKVCVDVQYGTVELSKKISYLSGVSFFRVNVPPY